MEQYRAEVKAAKQTKIRQEEKVVWDKAVAETKAFRQADRGFGNEQAPKTFAKKLVEERAKVTEVTEEKPTSASQEKARGR